MTTLELIEKHGIGHNCLSDAYALGYSQAETDYHKQTEKDRQSAYDCGYQQGRKDAIEEFVNRVIGNSTIKSTGEMVIEIRMDIFNFIYEQLKEKKNE